MHLLRNLIDQVVIAKSGVKASIAYEAIEKYLDHDKKFLDEYIDLSNKMIGRVCGDYHM